MGRTETGPARPAWRGWLTDPAVPALGLVLGAVAACWYAPLLTWSILGGLGGYALSGSV